MPRADSLSRLDSVGVEYFGTIWKCRPAPVPTHALECPHNFATQLADGALLPSALAVDEIRDLPDRLKEAYYHSA